MRCGESLRLRDEPDGDDIDRRPAGCGAPSGTLLRSADLMSWQAVSTNVLTGTTLNVTNSPWIGADSTGFFVNSGSTRPVSVGTVAQQEVMFALLQSSALRMCLQHSCSAMFIEVIGMAHSIVGVRTNSNATNVVKIRHGRTRSEPRRVSRRHSVSRIMSDILQPVRKGLGNMFFVDSQSPASAVNRKSPGTYCVCWRSIVRRSPAY